MKIGILGSGGVGRTLGAAFAAAGHEVMLGGRSADNANALEWQTQTGGQVGDLTAVAAFGDVVVNALKGSECVPALVSLQSELAGKVLIDVANPLDFSNGFPPSLTIANTDSLAEQLQQALPNTAVVKALNTVNTSVMVAPRELSEATDLFICGNDDDAKASVRALLVELGWEAERVRDLGDVSAARGIEAMLLWWVRTMSSLGTATFNVRLVAAVEPE